MQGEQAQFSVALYPKCKELQPRRPCVYSQRSEDLTVVRLCTPEPACCHFTALCREMNRACILLYQDCTQLNSNYV